MTFDIITKLGKRYVNSKLTGLERRKKKKLSSIYQRTNGLVGIEFNLS